MRLQNGAEMSIEAPKRVEKPDFGPVIELVREHMAEMEQVAAAGEDPGERCGLSTGDHDHYIYEAVLEAVYGEDVWDFINQNVDVDLANLPQEGDPLIHEIEVNQPHSLSACGVDTTPRDVLSDWDLSKVTCPKCRAKWVRRDGPVRMT